MLRNLAEVSYVICLDPGQHLRSSWPYSRLRTLIYYPRPWLGNPSTDPTFHFVYHLFLSAMQKPCQIAFLVHRSPNSIACAVHSSIRVPNHGGWTDDKMDRPRQKTVWRKCFQGRQPNPTIAERNRSIARNQYPLESAEQRGSLS